MMSNRATRFAPATLQAAADERAVYERYQRRLERDRDNHRDWLAERWERVFGNAS